LAPLPGSNGPKVHNYVFVSLCLFLCVVLLFSVVCVCFSLVPCLEVPPVQR